MNFSKTAKDGVDALLVDREDESVPQSFTHAELLSIRQNTLNHQARLVGVDSNEADIYLDDNHDGLSLIDIALMENAEMLTQCDTLGIA